MNERVGTRTHTVWFCVCVHFIMLPLSRRAKNCGRCRGGRWRQRDTPGVLSASSPTLCFAGKVRANLALTVSLWCTSSQRLDGWSVQSSLQADEAKPPPPDSRPWPRPAPRWPWATPRGAGGALLSLSVVAWQRCTPASPGAPALLFTLQTVKRSTLPFRGQGAAASGLRAVQACLSCPWACACTRAQRPSAQELMAHTLRRCGHEPGRRSGREEGRAPGKEGGRRWALPLSASQEPCDLEPLGPEASVSPSYLPFQSRGKQRTHKLRSLMAVEIAPIYGVFACARNLHS